MSKLYIRVPFDSIDEKDIEVYSDEYFRYISSKAKLCARTLGVVMESLFHYHFKAVLEVEDPKVVLEPMRAVFKEYLTRCFPKLETMSCEMEDSIQNTVYSIFTDYFSTKKVVKEEA